MESLASGSYHLRKLVKPLRSTTSQFAFPDHYDTPAQGYEGSLVPFVAGPVALKFRAPAIRVCPGQLEIVATIMGVPEAPMDKEGCSFCWKNQIGAAWQVSTVQAKP